MPGSPKPDVDCYSAGERAAMTMTQELRARLFSPVLGPLSQAGVRADHLTLLGLVCGMAFCAAYFWSKPLAFVLLTMHVLLDGLDGPLARHVGAASRRGSFTDTLADQIVVAATTVTLMSTGTLSVVPGSFYIFVYTLVVVFAFVRNALSIPYSWLVRPRFIVFAWLPVDTWLVPGSLDYAVWGFDVFLTLKLLTGFIKIRRMI